jgi:hypothetical protein
MHLPSLNAWKRLLPLTLGLLVLAGCSSTAPVDDPGPGSTDGGTGTPSDGGTTTSGECMASRFLASVGKERLLVGASMEDATAAQAPFDVRYLYLAGGLFDSSDACTSCTSGCATHGTSCANGGCGWWGCWQDVSLAPGEYARGFLRRAKQNSQLPFITYYEQLHTSRVGEGQQQVTALNNTAIMGRYFADWRFLLKQLGSERVLLHIEPDLWGYLQYFSHGNARSVPVAVASANALDCAGQENNATGLGRCMIAMVRKYAPNAKVGLHASAWATRFDVSLNRHAAFDVVAEANKVADFLKDVGAAEGDFIVVEASDRDAGYYETQGSQSWWDATDTTLPHFRQAFTWVRALSERLGKPNFWWQLPVGNMALPNRANQWRDNRVDSFFARTSEIAAAHGVGFAFGAGAGGQTTPETDNGNLVAKVRAYAQAGGQSACVR